VQAFSSFVKVGDGWCRDANGQNYEYYVGITRPVGLGLGPISPEECHKKCGKSQGFVGFETYEHSNPEQYSCNCLYTHNQIFPFVNILFTATHDTSRTGTGVITSFQSNAGSQCFRLTPAVSFPPKRTVCFKNDNSTDIFSFTALAKSSSNPDLVLKPSLQQGVKVGPGGCVDGSGNGYDYAEINLADFYPSRPIKEVCEDMCIYDPSFRGFQVVVAPTLSKGGCKCLYDDGKFPRLYVPSQKKDLTGTGTGPITGTSPLATDTCYKFV
jgi:hypothetical protein